MINGNRFSFVFDHKPSQAEILSAFSQQDIPTAKGTFLSCAQSYIRSKTNVLSPSTIKGYTSVLKSIPSDFKNKTISGITQTDIQQLVNDYAADHTPKTVRNYHGFISAVLRQFRPGMNLYTTLPQNIDADRYIPTEEDIRRILDASKNKPFYHIPFQLGVMGLRRSEICCLSLDDISGNMLTINKAIVLDVNNQWVVKTTKTAAGTRKIFIPDSLVEEIRKNGAIYDGWPNSLLSGLNSYQDKLNIPRFRFHDLRHFFASYAHSQGMSDADIMASGGWKSDYTMKRVYRHEMNAVESQKKLFSNLLQN